MAGLVPAIHVVQWRRGVLYCRRLLSAWAVYKPNHVDGRDKILWGRPRGLISCGCRPHGMERSDD
jgi:hypothetical protein